MPLHDFLCSRCSSITEHFILGYPPPDWVGCKCGGQAVRVWVKAPGLAGLEGGRYPYYDQQLGCTVESIRDRDRICKERGLVILGREEHARTLNQLHDNEDAPIIDKEAWHEAAGKAWQDIQSQAVPLERHETIEEVKAQTDTDLTVVSE